MDGISFIEIIDAFFVLFVLVKYLSEVIVGCGQSLAIIKFAFNAKRAVKIVNRFITER